MDILNKKELKIIQENIENIIYQSNVQQLRTLKPDINVLINIFNIILKYIKDKKLIIYGGYAKHLYLKKKLYDMDAEIPDIDAYSTDPVNNLIELANLLKIEHNIENVEVKESFHKDTFSLWVEYRNFLDLTFVPIQIYYKLKIKIIDNYKVIHSSLILLDILKQFNDPMVSYFRLEKILKRYSILQEKFLLKDYYNDYIDNNDTLKYLKNDIFVFIEKNILQSNMICGFYAYHFFSNDPFNKIPFFEIISTDYNKDKQYFYDILNKNFKKITKVEYYPFFQFITQKTIFYQDNKIILILYCNDNKCIPFLIYNNKKFLTYLYFIQHTFSLYIFYDFKKDFLLRDYMKNMIENVIVLKKKYFKKKFNKTIIDDTKFKYFVIQCQGDTDSPFTLFIKNLNNKSKKNNFKRFKYIPQKNSTLKSIKYLYEKVNGNIK